MGVRVAVLVGVLGLLFALVGSAPAASKPPNSVTRTTVYFTPAAATAVGIVVKEWSVAASTKSITAGKVTFVVRNAGTMKHEFVVIRSNLHHHLLQMSGQQASEVGVKGEIEPFGPGTTKRLTLTLAPGKYVLLCNMPGHYRKGQYLAFTVLPAATTAAQTSDVNVSLFEMGFKLSKTTVPHGTVVFHLKNDGKVPHDFSFGSRGGGSQLLQPGQTATFTVKFATPGKYTFICTVEGHQEGGMIGVLTVT